MAVQIEVREETANRLQAIAQALKLSLDDYLAKVAELGSLLPSNGAAINQKEPTPRNEAALAVIRRTSELLKDMPVSGSTEDTLKMIREARAGRMWEDEPAE